jgi:hypothetical protein
VRVSVNYVRHRTDARQDPAHPDVMAPHAIIVPLLSGLVFATGCATSDPHYSNNGYASGSAHSNENYYAVIISIDPGIAQGGVASPDSGNAGGPQDVYLIRVRFDDRSYQTVTQDALDGLRVGDSVRIEHDRVRRY